MRRKSGVSWWWLGLLLGLLVGSSAGCERLLSAPVRPYLDRPPEGSTTRLTQGETLSVVARFPAAREQPTAWWLVWQRADGTHRGRTALSRFEVGDGLGGHLDAWPPEPLPPGLYWLWVEAEGVPPTQRRSEVARVDIVAGPLTPTLSAGPTRPPLPTAGPTVPPTPLPVTLAPPSTVTPTAPCYRAGFVADVTLPDGTPVEMDQTYTKIWRLRNTGSCPWPADTYVAWIEPTYLNPPGEIRPALAYRLGRVVAPGEVVEVSVDLGTMVGDPGVYRQEYMLFLPDGTAFGVGPDGTQPFWAEVRVLPLPTVPPTPVPPSPTPIDDQPPTADSLSHTPDVLRAPPCKPAQVTFRLEGAEDASGLATVLLVWWVRTDTVNGEVQSQPMTPASQGAYTATLTYADLAASLAPPYISAEIVYYVRLQDGVGLWSTIYSDDTTIDIQGCGP